MAAGVVAVLRLRLSFFVVRWWVRVLGVWFGLPEKVRAVRLRRGHSSPPWNG